MVTEKIVHGDLDLDETVVKATNNSVQHILDCVPSTTRVLLSIDEVPIEESLAFKKPITMMSTMGTTKLQCSSAGIQIRCSKVTWAIL